MFVEHQITLVDFYKYYLDAALKSDYEFVICLIARCADSPEIFDEVRKYWSSFHDITGSKSIFLFAGDELPSGKRSASITFDRNPDPRSNRFRNAETVNSRYIAIPNEPDLIASYNISRSIVDRLPQLEQDYNMFDTHTLQMSQLRDYLDIPENALPCLHFTSLRDNASGFIDLNKGDSVYNIVKKFYTDVVSLVEVELSLPKRIQDSEENLRILRNRYLRLAKTPDNLLLEIHKWANNMSGEVSVAMRDQFDRAMKDILSTSTAEVSLSGYRANCYAALNVVRSIVSVEDFKFIRPKIQTLISKAEDVGTYDADTLIPEIRRCREEVEAAEKETKSLNDQYLKLKQDNRSGLKSFISSQVRHVEDDAVAPFDAWGVGDGTSVGLYSVSRSLLLETLQKSLSVDDVRSLCFELGVDYEELSGQVKSTKIISLLEYLNRRKRIGELGRWLVNRRPDIKL